MHGDYCLSLDPVPEQPSKLRSFSRSNKTADEEVYALIKLSRNIENPHRGRVQGLLKGVVKFRKISRFKDPTALL